MDAIHAAVARLMDGRRSDADIVRALQQYVPVAAIEAALADLTGLGFLARALDGTPRWSGRDFEAVVPSLLALLEERYELHEIEQPDSPCFFFVAVPRADAGHLLPPAARLESGRGAAACGFTRADALIRCLGEAAETVSACWHGDELVEIGSWNEVRDHAIHPNELMGYSERQYRERDAWNAIHGAYDWIPPPLADDTPIAWTTAHDLATGEPVLIPAAYAFIGFRDEGLAEPFYIADSNGCAVGASEADAIERGFLELVERDATGIWWYAQRRCPAVHPADVAAAGVEHVIEWHRRSGRTLTFLDITSDLEVRVCVAVSADQDGRRVLLGFGAAREAPAAVLKALSELVQMEIGALMATTGTGPSSSVPPRLDTWYRNVSMTRFPTLCAWGQPTLWTHTVPGADPFPAASVSMTWLSLQSSRFPLAMTRSHCCTRVSVQGIGHYRLRLGALLAPRGGRTNHDTAAPSDPLLHTPLCI